MLTECALHTDFLGRSESALLPPGSVRPRVPSEMSLDPTVSSSRDLPNARSGRVSRVFVCVGRRDGGEGGEVQEPELRAGASSCPTQQAVLFQGT